MNPKKTKNVFTLLVISFFVFTTLGFAVDKDYNDMGEWESDMIKTERGRYKPHSDEAKKEKLQLFDADRPEENYIQQFTAKDIVEQLKKDNLEQIYMIKVIIDNFDQGKNEFYDLEKKEQKKDESWKAQYDNIYKEYKHALQLNYRRDVVYSAQLLIRNKKRINELFRSIALKYRDQLMVMLDKSADALLIISLNESIKSDPNKVKALEECRLRLQISYGQLDEAAKAGRSQKYQEAIFHLRVAKRYVIRVIDTILDEEALKNVKKIPEDKRLFAESDLKEIEGVRTALIKDLTPLTQTSKDKKDILAVHRSDNLNRVYNPKK